MFSRVARRSNSPTVPSPSMETPKRFSWRGVCGTYTYSTWPGQTYTTAVKKEEDCFKEAEDFISTQKGSSTGFTMNSSCDDFKKPAARDLSEDEEEDDGEEEEEDGDEEEEQEDMADKAEEEPKDFARLAQGLLWTVIPEAYKKTLKNSRVEDDRKKS